MSDSSIDAAISAADHRVGRTATGRADLIVLLLDTDDPATGLPLTVQVIHETSRRCPPAAVVTRMAMHDAVVDGFRIPAGTDVVVGIDTLHRDPDGWDHPDSFDPARFSPPARPAMTAGSTCRSAVGHAPASATTSPCWRPHRRWPPWSRWPNPFSRR